MNRWWLVLMILSFGALSAEAPEYCHMASCIMRQFSQEIQKKYHVVSAGGGGGFLGDINGIDLAFTGHQKYSIDDVRPMIVDAARRLLELINTNEEIRPYLCEYPFPAKRVTISFGFCENDGVYVDEPHIGLVMCCVGKIEYFVSHRLPSGYRSPMAEKEVIFQETFEEAEKIVMESLKSITP